MHSWQDQQRTRPGLPSLSSRQTCLAMGLQHYLFGNHLPWRYFVGDYLHLCQKTLRLTACLLWSCSISICADSEPDGAHKVMQTDKGTDIHPCSKVPPATGWDAVWLVPAPGSHSPQLLTPGGSSSPSPPDRQTDSGLPNYLMPMQIHTHQ